MAGIYSAVDNLGDLGSGYPELQQYDGKQGSIKMNTTRISRLIQAVIACVMVSTGSALAAEERTATAIASWEGIGRVFEVAPGQAFFLGSFAGTMFVQHGDGAFNIAEVVCPGTLDILIETNEQVGSGRCIITALDGDQVFGKWECEGAHLVGCIGSFEIIGGTGRFAGISGKSEFVARSAIARVVVDALKQSASEASKGIAVWRNLTYKIP